MNSLDRFDWDFSALYAAELPELMACCFYEYARESRSIMAHCRKGKPVSPAIAGKLHYHARIDGTLLTLPSPLVWPWGKIISPQFISTDFLGIKPFSAPWQKLSEQWRKIVSDHYRPSFLSQFLPPAFRRGDSTRMKRTILSRGIDRAGVDDETGNERIVVEIDWASYTDDQIVKSFSSWVKNRPQQIGLSSLKGRTKGNSWKRKLDNLAIMRLLHHSIPSELPQKFPSAQKRYGQLEKRELHKKREDAVRDFHELFPFLPPTEKPLSWSTKGRCP